MDEFKWPVRVYYEDTDAGGVVYHANYLKYLERARTEMLRDLGFELDQLNKVDEILFVVHKVTIDYLKPAHMNDMLTVIARIKNLRKASIIFEQYIQNNMQENLCLAEIVVACVNSKSLKPVQIPVNIISELANVD